MILYFIAGWIAGVVGTLWFGRWLTKRYAKHEDEH